MTQGKNDIKYCGMVLALKHFPSEENSVEQTGVLQLDQCFRHRLRTSLGTLRDRYLSQEMIVYRALLLLLRLFLYVVEWGVYLHSWCSMWMMIKSVSLKLSCRDKLLSICAWLGKAPPVPSARCTLCAERWCFPRALVSWRCAAALCALCAWIMCVEEFLHVQDGPGAATGTGPWNWVTPAACLEGQLVPMVRAVGQVDFSTGLCSLWPSSLRAPLSLFPHL